MDAFSIVLLKKEHDLEGFDCGKQPLNDFLQKFSITNQTGGSARTYVAVVENKVVAYYSLAPGCVVPADVPDRIKKGQPNHPVPVILMARFAVDLRFQGKGLGKALFRDALLRSLNGAEAIGGRAFFVQAKDDEAKSFYLKYGMEQSPTQPYNLFLLFKDIKASLL